MLVYFYAPQISVEGHTVVDWCAFIRDVCSADLLANPQQLGGPGHTVAIDESLMKA